VTTSLHWIATSLNVPPALSAFIAELFAGVTSLGSMPGDAVRLLREAEVGARSRVLDLACGKGATAILAARRLGCRVEGVDVFAPFIEEGTRAAAAGAASRRCHFMVGRVEHLAPSRPPFDAAIMIGLLGAPEAAPILRRHVRPGGIYLVDDLVRDPRLKSPPRFEVVPTIAQLRGVIERLGDTLERVWRPSPSSLARMNERLIRRVGANAAALARNHPEFRSDFRTIAPRFAKHATLLTGSLRPALFVVRRGPTTEPVISSRRHRRASSAPKTPQPL
jgi:SAM-dependent methyltransferase